MKKRTADASGTMVKSITAMAQPPASPPACLKALAQVEQAKIEKSEIMI
tara:strand:- start:738 stop:884 length:147 start_codon:yes stop_codon:yes gene_type:complete